MDNYFIKIKDANLYYPSKPYNATTLKEHIFRTIQKKSKNKLICDVHALKNITLDINEGERVGIIGHNGAGKSTLLKAIAGLYPLQSGTLQIKGDIRALFELSLGFEFEATGRENILYRGLLLGDTPKGIKEKEQEIIEFADLGEFIDYPIKTYSAGMLVRLAFAISTTIRGDILLLDEILGAGDAKFMKKAQHRMTQLINDAKILILISHDLTSIKSICNRVICMQNGQIIADGEPEEIINFYLKNAGGMI